MNAKKTAAEHAVASITDGMVVGIGTGTTTQFAIEAIGMRVKEGLSIRAVASSTRSEDLARSAGITLIPFSEVETIQLYIDGADEVDRELNLIKGGGGALLREKLLAFNAERFIVIVDGSKLVETLGKFRLPVEIVPFAMELTLRHLQHSGCAAAVRYHDGRPYITDNGNLIVDCDYGKIEKVSELHYLLNAIPGIVENGLFPETMVSSVIVGHEDGTFTVLSK